MMHALLEERCTHMVINDTVMRMKYDMWVMVDDGRGDERRHRSKDEQVCATCIYIQKPY